MCGTNMSSVFGLISLTFSTLPATETLTMESVTAASVRLLQFAPRSGRYNSVYTTASSSDPRGVGQRAGRGCGNKHRAASLAVWDAPGGSKGDRFRLRRLRKHRSTVDCWLSGALANHRCSDKCRMTRDQRPINNCEGSNSQPMSNPFVLEIC